MIERHDGDAPPRCPSRKSWSRLDTLDAELEHAQRCEGSRSDLSSARLAPVNKPLNELAFALRVWLNPEVVLDLREKERLDLVTRRTRRQQRVELWNQAVILVRRSARDQIPLVQQRPDLALTVTERAKLVLLLGITRHRFQHYGAHQVSARSASRASKRTVGTTLKSGSS